MGDCASLTARLLGQWRRLVSVFAFARLVGRLLSDSLSILPSSRAVKVGIRRVPQLAYYEMRHIPYRCGEHTYVNRRPLRNPPRYS